MAASEKEDELRSARRWTWATLALAAVVFAYGVWRSPPVTFVHVEHAERHSRAPPTAGETEQEQTPESGQENRTSMLPWLYLLKR